MTTTPVRETEISEVPASLEPEGQPVTQAAAPPPARPAGMQDMTTGPITRHLLKTTSFMLDLYWVGRLGTDAVAAVGIAGNLSFIVLALTQMLGVGTTTVVSHAVGRRDHDEALLLFNQSQVLAMLTGVVVFIV